MANLQTTLQPIGRYGVYVATLIGLLSISSCGGGGNEAGTAGSGDVAVKPNAAAITSLTATPAILTNSGTSTLKWTSTLTKSCILSNNGSATTVDANGSYTTPTLSSTATFTLTCTGTYGGSAKASVQILVSAATQTPPTTTTSTSTSTTPTTTTSTTSPTPTTSTVEGMAAACAAAPLLSGTVHYYCDCGTGAQSGCRAGNDANPGTDPLLPRQTIANAAIFIRSQAGVNDTVALCKGGAFNATTSLNIGSSRCPTGTTCNDLREYTPTTFQGTAKPIINNAAGAVTLFYISGNVGGVRLLNLRLNGDNGAIRNGNRGFFFYSGPHDVTMCNLDMDGFDIAVTSDDGIAQSTNIKLTGSHITNSRRMGYLGSGLNSEVSYNYWAGNGSSNGLDHTLYISSSKPTSNVQVVGNYISGQYGPSCLGSIITVHGEFDGLTIEGNEINVDASANVNGGCWGIDLNNGAYPIPIYFRHTSVSGNTLRNTGNAAIDVEDCPGCLIENNLIIENWFGAAYGIVAPAAAARTTPADAVNTANIVRNNTIYFGPAFVNQWGGATGIKVGIEGTGHIISNNTVYYQSSTSSGNFSCFGYSLPLGSYAFINNNHCYSAAPYSWVAGRGGLDAWKAYAAGSGFDSASFTGNPSFTAVGTEFTPTAVSPLIGKGNAANGSTHDITGKVRPSPPAIGAYER